MAEDTNTGTRTTTRTRDDEVAAILASGAAGVETAIQALEGAEHVYYGAVAATESSPVITTTNVSPYSPDPAV